MVWHDLLQTIGTNSITQRRFRCEKNKMKTNKTIIIAIKECVKECKTKNGFSCDFAARLMKKLNLVKKND